MIFVTLFVYFFQILIQNKCENRLVIKPLFNIISSRGFSSANFTRASYINQNTELGILSKIMWSNKRYLSNT